MAKRTDVALGDLFLLWSRRESDRLFLFRATFQTTESNAERRPQVIVLEDLSVEGMKRHRTLARTISDVGMGEFRRQMRDKSVWNGERLVLAPRFFPSSKQCHGCHWKWEEMKLSDRIFLCQNGACR